jgi:hypothetical protein
MPFKTSVICTYFNWLAFDCNYSLGYIKKHRSVLIKYYDVKHKYKILQNELLEIADCCKQIKKDHPNKNQGFGKAPCTYEDLKNILKSIPKNYRRGLLISSLATSAFLTSARRKNKKYYFH